MNNFDIWNKAKQPPRDALKQIAGGRLSGMTDINPQWRMEKATEIFGPCGIGWKYTIEKLWREDGAEGVVFAFAQINFYIKNDLVWSDPIPGFGGSQLIQKESKGLYSNDEAYKMAITDALSVAFKALGFGSDVYRGRWDGSKYSIPQIQELTYEELKKMLTRFLQQKDKDGNFKLSENSRNTLSAELNKAEPSERQLRIYYEKSKNDYGCIDET